MVYILSGLAVYKAGAGVGAVPGTAWVTWISGVEAFINVATRYNWSDVYSGLNADVKYILNDIGESLVANEAIKYNMAGYTSRIEAEDMINVNRDTALRGLQILRDKKSQDFTNAA